MERWRDVTLGDLAAGIKRYQPFIATVVAVLCVIAFLPGEQAPDNGAAGSDVRTGAFGQPLDGATDATDTTETTVAGAGGPVGGVDVPGAPTSSNAGPVGSGSGGPTGGSTAGSGSPLSSSVQHGPECDPATGRVRVPSRFSPPSAPVWRAGSDNGGSTYQGVTKDTITIVNYQSQVNPATDAALTAAGANNSDADEDATLRDYVDLFNKHFQFYGRQIKVVTIAGSGATEDDAAARADAIKVASEIKAFASIGAPSSNAYANELAARRVLCICTVSQPVDFYTERAPYIWPTTLMSSHQGYVHRAEYVGKRLAKRPAKWAGDAVMANQQRVFGLLWYETADNAYKSGIEFFKQELGRYGVSLKNDQAFTGANIDPAATQNQARTQIAKLKADGVTSVIFSGDPLSPAIFTSEATRQNYFPEWVLTGSALTDTTIFGRTYDTAQWRHAFGVSFLPARLRREVVDTYKLHMWHHGRPPTAGNTYAVVYANPFILATGIHMAGPKLTPSSFRDGLFAYPASGGGMVTSAQTSWGPKGPLWQWDDYTQWDDVTEIWWDSSATGPDEPGHDGVGMYRYVDGGKRYLPGKHPTTDPKVFDPNGSVTIYANPPASDGAPTYEHKHY